MHCKFQISFVIWLFLSFFTHINKRFPIFDCIITQITAKINRELRHYSIILRDRSGCVCSFSQIIKKLKKHIDKSAKKFYDDGKRYV